MATGNAGKIAAIRRLLDDLPVRLYAPEQLGLRLEVDETGSTFSENALLKARSFRDASGMAALADDSGLCVDALGGAPGLYSARFGGLYHSAAEKNRLLLDMMKQIPAERRGAEFISVIAYASDPGQEWTVEGRVRGFIADRIRGEHGFGFDPVFLPPEYDRTFAELTPDEKDLISHRGIAMRRARDHLKNGAALLE